MLTLDTGSLDAKDEETDDAENLARATQNSCGPSADNVPGKELARHKQLFMIFLYQNIKDSSPTTSYVYVLLLMSMVNR